MAISVAAAAGYRRLCIKPMATKAVVTEALKTIRGSMKIPPPHTIRPQFLTHPRPPAISGDVPSTRCRDLDVDYGCWRALTGFELVIALTLSPWQEVDAEELQGHLWRLASPMQDASRAKQI